MRKRNVIVGGALGVSAAVIASGAALATNDDDEGNVTGTNADKATAAALKATGGGQANAVELDNENGATWEVEVTKPDGKTVDVRLDENYAVIVIEDDSETG